MTAVLHVTQPTSAGVARTVLSLAVAQAAAGLDVTVACPDGELPGRLAAAGVRWRVWESERGPGPEVLRERARLRHIMAGLRPDLVHLHSSKAGLVGRLALRGRHPTVFQPHAWSFLASGRTRAAAVGWERYAARWAHMTLFCSHRELRQGEAAGIAAVGRVVLNGVDLTRFAPPADPSAARRTLGLPEEARVAVVVGRKSVQKGQDVALAAWPLVRAAVPGALLVLMGEGYGNSVDGVHGVVTYAARPDVRPVLAAADLVLSPSRWEGLSLSLLEGMASGRPTVASDVAGSAEALLGGPLPPAGTVVPPQDVAGLAAAVTAHFAAPELCRHEGVAARRRAEATYAAAGTATAVHEVYQLLLGRPSRQPKTP